MEDKEYEKKIRRFRRRVCIEAFWHAGSIGFAAGLSVMAVILLTGRLWMKELWLAEAGITGAVLFALVMIVCMLLFYPKRKAVLARIDGLGLQERMITMEELKQAETVIAKVQRWDAKTSMGKLKTGDLKLKRYPVPFFFCIGMGLLTALLILVPLPEKPVDEQAEKNVQELQMVDELITVLHAMIERAEITDSHKEGLKEIVEALAVSFTPEDSTLTRTAKIATASRRLDIYEATEQDEVNILKQMADTSEGARQEVRNARTEQIRLSHTVQDMKNKMGTLMDVLNMVEGSVWSPEMPSPSTYSEEEFPPEELEETEEFPEGEDVPEGEEMPEGTEPGEEGEPEDGMEGNPGTIANELIYDPERGEVSYGIVYEEYYQAILKALTEQEYSEDIRKMIEDYANSLE